MSSKKKRVRSTPSGSVKVLSSDSVKLMPRKARESHYDPYAEALREAGKDQGVLIPIPEGSSSKIFRQSTSTGMRRSLSKLGEKATRVSVKLTEDGKSVWVTRKA